MKLTVSIIAQTALVSVSSNALLVGALVDLFSIVIWRPKVLVLADKEKMIRLQCMAICQYRKRQPESFVCRYFQN